MSATIIFLHLAIAIALILLLTIKYKINATLTLVIASLYMGIACGMGPVETVDIVGKGFGGTMAGLGLAIGFGVILGQLLSDSGGAYVIADRMTAIFPERKALAAITATAFVLAIPVFFDVTFVILMPIGIALAKKIDRPLLEVSSMLTLGAVTAHTLVPPTPNPLAAAEIFHFDLGMMILMGTVVGGLACVVAGFIILRIQRRPGFWNPDKDVNKNYVMTEETPAAATAGRRLPSFGISLLPIFLPVVLILLGTCTKAIFGATPMLIDFLQNRITSLLLGALAAYWVASRVMTRDEIDKAGNKALESAGIVILITGAGGSFGAVISATGIGKLIQDMIGTSAGSVLPALLIAYFVAMVLRVSLGSGTVASITAMNIMAPVVIGLPVHPVYVAIACLAGGCSLGHVNDSGFWVVTNMSGFNLTGGVKSYSLACIVMSLTYLAILLALSSVLPMAPA